MRYIRKTGIILVCLVLLFTYTGTVRGNNEDFFSSDMNMLIGLLFGNGAVASFQTSSETGFLFGYVGNESPDKFNVLFYSPNTKIRVSRSAHDNAAVITNPDTGEEIFRYLDGNNHFAAVAASPSNMNMTDGQAICALSSQNTGLTTTPAGNIKYGAMVYRMTGSGVEVLNLVSLEDYVKGVMPYEIPTSWGDEAQKAFSIAVRSYSARSVRRHSRDGFMLCNNTHCQVYRGAINATERTNAAVDATRDLVMTYRKSQRRVGRKPEPAVSCERSPAL
jgi:hypothetical protein